MDVHRTWCTGASCLVNSIPGKYAHTSIGLNDGTPYTILEYDPCEMGPMNPGSPSRPFFFCETLANS